MKEQTVSIKKLKLANLKLKVVGVTPFLSEPMDIAVLERYDNKKSNKTFTKDILSEEEKAKEKYYYTSDGKKGILARAFYNSMIRASSYLFSKEQGGMRNVKEGIAIIGDVLPLEYSREEIATHWGRTSGKTRAPRKIMRPCFYDWSTILNIQFNEEQLSAEQVVNILNYAGFYIGVGGFRKEKTGTYGMFKVVV